MAGLLLDSQKPIFIHAKCLVTLLFWITLPTTFQNTNSDYILFYEPVARNILAGRGFMCVWMELL